jgi:hypothetical protein
LLRKLSLSSEYAEEEQADEDDVDVCTSCATTLSLAFLVGAAADGVPALRLQSFAADSRFCCPTFLSRLPASSIESLELTMTLSQIQAPSLPRIFQQFSNLQTLDLKVIESTGDLDDDEEEEGGMEQLPAAFFLGLPASLETLHICAYDYVECLLAIQHLTALRALQLDAWQGIAVGSTLPQSLLAATFLDAPMPDGACSVLSALQQLTLNIRTEESSGSLLQLSGLKALRELCLEYDGMWAAAAGAAAWSSLPQLKALQVWHLGGGGDVECQAVLEGLATARTLTSVDLHLPSSSGEQPCGVHFAELENLQQLVLWRTKSSRDDMLHLGKLTQLTALDLTLCSIDDATAAELLGSLTGLKSLALLQSQSASQQEGEARVMTDAIVPVIKYQLKGLRELSLSVPGVTDASVGLLKGLTQLTRLIVGVGPSGLSGQGVDMLRQMLVGCDVTMGMSYVCDDVAG